MMQYERPDDFVLGTGETHSVREFLDEAFGYMDLGWHNYCEVDEKYLRPTDVPILKADCRKAQMKLGWNPRITFCELVRIMVDCDLEALGLSCPGHGKSVLKNKGLSWNLDCA